MKCIPQMPMLLLGVFLQSLPEQVCLPLTLRAIWSRLVLIIKYGLAIVAMELIIGLAICLAQVLFPATQ